MSQKVVTGVDDLRRVLAKARDVAPGLLNRERLGAFLLRRMRARFLEEKDPDGRPWKELSPNTAEGAQKLIQTGNLFKAMSIMGTDRGGYSSSTGAGFRIGIKSRKYTQRFAKGGSRVADTAVYGRVHQLGNRHVPQRKFIGIGESDVRAVSDLIRRELRRAVKGI